MTHLITASFSSPVAKDAPGEIVYIPAGSSKINATVNGKPKEVTVNVTAARGEEIASKLQAALSSRLESTVRPRLAFDHAKTGPASGHPTAFSFDPERGIILAASWSNSGRAAIEGGDYGYFSPTFLIDDDGTPSGLPSKGEIGSLVDEPAFRTIGLIAASHSPDEIQNQTMSKLIFSALAITPTDENAESAAVTKISAMQSEVTVQASRIVELEGELTAASDKLSELNKSRAESIVKAAVADGRLLSKDDDKIEKFRAKIEAGDTFAEEILASLPKLNADLTKTIVLGSDKPTSNEDRFKGLTGIQLLEASLSEEFESHNKSN